MSQDATLTPTDPRTLAQIILKAVWWSIFLGLFVQVMILVVKTTMPSAKTIPDVGQRVTWSVLVCSGLAVGNTLAKARPLLLGFTGLLAGPVAFAVAKAAQKSLGASGAAGTFPVPSGIELAIMRAIEYGLFGILIGYAGRRGNLKSYLVTGAGLGLVFTVYHLTRIANFNETSPPAIELVTRGINELLFPIGCALILWVTTEVGSRLADYVAGQNPVPANA